MLGEKIIHNFKEIFETNVLSIDIGTCNTKLVLGRQQNKAVFIEDAWSFPTPENTFYDGRIIETGKLQNEIWKTLLERRIKAKKVICTLESTSVITREILLPITKPEEMDTMIRYEIEQYLPIMLSEYVIEYKILEEVMEEGVKKARVLVVALPRTVAESYMDLIKGMSLSPMALDIHSNGIPKLFSSSYTINKENSSLDKTVAVIDLGHSYLNVHIISKGIAQFNRLVTLGGKDMDINLANSFNLSLEDAQQKKISSCNLIAQDEESITAIMLKDVVKNSIDLWIQEIQRIFQYYISRSGQKNIDGIYLYGGSAQLKGIEQFIYDAFNLPTFNIESMSNVKTSSKAKNIGLNPYLNAIGAIIRK